MEQQHQPSSELPCPDVYNARGRNLIAANIPTQLKELPQWVAWKSDPPRKPGGKRTKVPVDPKSGGNASSTDSATWASFDEAIQRAATDSLAGVGFVLTLDAGIVGIDLDHCRDPQTREIEPWARDVIRKLDSYTEISPSGTGVHVLVRGAMPEGRKRHGNVEVYATARYLTVSGARVEGTPTGVEERTAELAAIHAEFLGDHTEKQRARDGEARDCAARRSLPVASDRWVRVSGAADWSDEELLEQARCAKNGVKFASLYDGGDPSGYVSQSEADLALCSLLSFWTGQDAQRVDRLFRSSALMRGKWDEARGDTTYGAQTIETAISGATEIYTGGNADLRWRASTGGLELQASLGSDGSRVTFKASGNGTRPFTKTVRIDDEKSRSGLAEKLVTLGGTDESGIVDCLDELADLVEDANDGGNDRRGGSGGGGGSCADDVASLAIDVEGVELFHTPGRQGSDAFATIVSGNTRETLRVRGALFREWVTRRYWETSGGAPSASCLSDGIAAISAAAKYGANSKAYKVELRVARDGDDVWLDLGDDEGRAVRITKNGWSLVESVDVPVRFQRRPGIQPLPAPLAGGSVELLRPFVNMPDEPSWKLFVATMTTYLLPEGPYVVLVVNGEQGSAKSTLVRRLRELIDPNTAALRRPPTSERDLMISACNAWVVAYDNLSSLSKDMSDSLCSLATGAGFGTRLLYTDDEERLFEAARPIVLNGIDDIVTRPDLLDRSVLLTLPTIPEENRQEESVQNKGFAAVRALVLGALLDGVAAVLRDRGSVKLTRKPRMADFAVSAVASASAFGWTQEEILNALEANRAEANEIALGHSVVAQGIQRLVDSDPTGEWSGTATALLRALSGTDDPKEMRRLGWPKNARGMRCEIDRVAPSLRLAGIHIAFERNGRQRERIIRICKVQKRPSASSAPSATSSTGSGSPISGGRSADGRGEQGFGPSASEQGENAIGDPAEADQGTPADEADGADGRSATSQDGSLLPEPESGGPLREALCMSCSGTVFVRLKNGRRCVCPTCEAVRPEEIEGLDSGYAGAPLDEEKGGS